MVYTWFTYELYGLDMVYIGIIWYIYIYMWFIHGLHMNYKCIYIYMVYIYTWFIHRV